MEDLNTGILPETKPQRPMMLTILCILTFIGSGMNLFSSLFIAGFYDTYIEIVQVFTEKFQLEGMETLLDAKPMFFMVSAIFYAGSLAGALFMYRLKKKGFHFYTVFQILLILAPMYFMHLQSPGIPELLFTGLFILLYSRHLKFMS
ncbi:MAG: hypothetical protein Q8M08_16810 [Bacteroidales bacterium]|nr:hypothetical protein [Bacteroidales bacterium]